MTTNSTSNSSILCPAPGSVQFFDCNLIWICPCFPLEADPDIGGIGVVTAFVGTCGIAILISITALTVLPEDPEANLRHPFSRILDRLEKVRIQLRVDGAWRDGFERVVLAFSDQQLVTGIAILLVGWIRLPALEGQISSYHFTVVTDLAWFSATTHLFTLFVLQDYFRNPQRSVLRNIRITLMIALGIFLIISLGFASQPGFMAMNCPAECVMLNDPPSGFNTSAAFSLSEVAFDFKQSQNRTLLIVNVSTLIYGYLCAMLPMFPYTQILVNRVRNLFGGVTRFFVDSRTIVLLLNFEAFVIGVYQLFAHRAIARNDFHVQGENIWGFGQILSLILLLTPGLAGLEVYYDKRAEEKRKQESGEELR